MLLIMTWFKFVFGLIFFKPVSLFVCLVSDNSNKHEAKENKDQNGLKTFKANPNHNKFILKYILEHEGAL